MSGIRTADGRRHGYARRPGRARTVLAIAAAVGGLVTGLLLAPGAQAAPPTPPSAAEARTMLNILTVAAEGSMNGYDRDLFPHWISQGDSCDTREIVLQRDGSDVTTDSACRAVGGRWYSAYDGVTETDSSDLDIDHVVPLAEAWRSGADSWSYAKRRSFANNLSAAQLIAVSASSNRSKGDRDPAEWMPPRSSYHCTYARMWVWVKYNYYATIDPAEKSALSGVLSDC